MSVMPSAACALYHFPVFHNWSAIIASARSQRNSISAQITSTLSGKGGFELCGVVKPLALFSLEKVMEDLGRCEHLSDAMLLPRHITHEGASLQGCDSFILVADADQSRLLVSNSTHDTALSHSTLESIVASQKQVVLAVVGGRMRGLQNPPAPLLWSPTAEKVLRQTNQILALQIVEEGKAMSWVSTASREHGVALAAKLGLRQIHHRSHEATGGGSVLQVSEEKAKAFGFVMMAVGCGALLAAPYLQQRQVKARGGEAREGPHGGRVGFTLTCIRVCGGGFILAGALLITFPKLLQQALSVDK